MLRADEMVKKVTVLKARKNLGQLLEEVYYRGISTSLSAPASRWPRSFRSGT
jgi:hypothetical protein